MRNPRRAVALTIAVVALALTIFGVTYAATDATPGGGARDLFHLNGYPPKYASFDATVSAAHGVRLSLTGAADFVHDRLEATVTFPFAVTTIDLDLVDADSTLYLRDAQASSGPWEGLRTESLPLFGIALELTHPDLDLISGTHRSVRHGDFTVHTFVEHDVPLRTILGGSGTSSLGSITWSITTGREGEVVASRLRVVDGRTTTVVTLTILTYNRPIHIAVPSGKVQMLSPSIWERLLNEAHVGGIVAPSLGLPGTGQLS